MTLTAQQMEARKHGIGGSDAPVALGVSKWRTPMDLYMDKLGHPAPFVENEKMEWGTTLEPVIRTRWAEKRGVNVEPVTKTIVSRDHPFMVANVDGIVLTPQGYDGLEIKTVSGPACMDWGEQETDEVPLDYLVQVYHYAIVTRIPRWYVAALFNGSELRTYIVEAKAALCDRIVAAERTFWQHVERKEPPQPISADDVRLLWPQSKSVAVNATEDVRLHVAAIGRLSNRIDAIQKEVDRRKAIVTSFMGEADTLTDDGKPLLTWKSTKASTKVDLDALRAKFPDVAKACSIPTTPTRRFLIK